MLSKIPKDYRIEPYELGSVIPSNYRDYNKINFFQGMIESWEKKLAKEAEGTNSLFI